MKETIASTFDEHESVVARFRETGPDAIAAIAERCIRAIEAGGKICFFGNGGSAADAQHLATEIVVRFVRNRKALPAIAFTTDTSILTACANDFGYEEVFARQVEGLCGPDDVVIGISTSGNSPNVVRGLEAAGSADVFSVAFTGGAGGKCAEIADLSLCVPSDVTARIQECHLIAGHLVCDLVEARFAN